jgi:hypothetical protein
MPKSCDLVWTAGIESYLTQRNSHLTSLLWVTILVVSGALLAGLINASSPFDLARCSDGARGFNSAARLGRLGKTRGRRNVQGADAARANQSTSIQGFV